MDLHTLINMDGHQGCHLQCNSSYREGMH